MTSGELGKAYDDGQIITRQGEEGDCMFVIQSGQVEIVRETDGREILLAVRGEGEVFGEMAVFERHVRMATVRAKGPVRILTVDRKGLMRRLQEDPSLAFRMIEMMSRRIRQLSEEVARLKGAR